MGLSVRYGDVADQRYRFDLFIDRNAPILLAFPVEIAEHDSAESAESGEVGSGHMVLLGEGR